MTDKSNKRRLEKLFTFDSCDSLTEEQLNTLLNPEFNEEQLQQIGWGLIHGLTYDEVMIYADPKFNKEKMQVIRWAIEDGLSEEKIDEFLISKMDVDEMEKE